MKWELVLVTGDGREAPHWSSYTRERSREELRSLKAQSGGKLPSGIRAIIRRISP